MVSDMSRFADETKWGYSCYRGLGLWTLGYFVLSKNENVI